MTPESIGQPENLLAEEYYAALEEQEVSSSADQTKKYVQSDSPVEKETCEAAHASGRR